MHDSSTENQDAGQLNFTISTAEVGKDDLDLVGGKGANLGELTRANLPVPPAYCVTTHAYAEFVETNNLFASIEQELQSADYGNIIDLTARAARIRAAFEQSPIPVAIEQAVRDSYAELERNLGKNNVMVSVRSSATAEDLPGMSFAGQQDTYLNIQGADSVVSHVRRCWASLWTDRAIAYRERQGFEHTDVKLAVVVQEMFPSAVSGVMFTANPVTSNPNEIFINTSWGLGEAIVSGKVNPDQYVVDKKTYSISSKIINDKLIMTAGGDDGTGSEEIDVPAHMQKEETLSPEQISELAALGCKIEDYYGFYQDIEWGYADGRFALLQSREVTAADLDFSYELEAYQNPVAREELTDEKWIWSRHYSDEFQTGPSTPWFYSLIQAGMTDLKLAMFDYMEVDDLLGYKAKDFDTIPMYRWYGARAYYNVAIEKERIRMFIPPFARDEQTLLPFPEKDRAGIKKMLFNWPRFLWVMAKLHITNPRVSLLETPQIMFDNAAEINQKTDAYWATRDLKRCTARELLSGTAETRAIRMNGLGPSKGRGSGNVVLPFTIYLCILPAALQKLCEAWLGDKDSKISGALLSGLNSKTGEENIAVWKLAEEIRKAPALHNIVMSDLETKEVLAQIRECGPAAESFLADLDDFLVVYGQRGGAERDSYHPRYSRAPEKVFVPIRAMLREGEAANPETMEHRLSERMQATREDCLVRLRKGVMGFIKAPFFNWLVELTQQYAYYRDFERFYFDRNYARSREFLEILGQRFVAQGLMSDPEAVFFLAREEIIETDEGELTAAQIDARIRARRRVYDRYSRKEPPKFIQGWKCFDDAELEDDGLGLRGVAASSGQVTGTARVCRSLDEIAKIQRGDILVTVSTDPGWTTLFSIIGGVVVETGGVVAHAVLISREFGLPCVANLSQACDRIPDGATITVDGTSGRVIVHDSAE